MSWTEGEKAYAIQFIPRHGYRKVAKRLGKKPENVWAFSRRHSCMYGDVKGYIRANEVSQMCGDALANIIRIADVAGVTLRLGERVIGKYKGARIVLVKEQWGLEYAEKINAKREGQELAKYGYLNLKQAARYLGVGNGTIMRAAKGQGCLGQMFQKVRTVKGLNNATLCNPYDLEPIRVWLEDMRAKAQKLTSTKSLSVELGLNQGHAAILGKSLGGVSLLYKGRWMCFLDESQVQAFYEHYGYQSGRAA